MSFALLGKLLIQLPLVPVPSKLINDSLRYSGSLRLGNPKAQPHQPPSRGGEWWRQSQSTHRSHLL